jgi:hypothetical protein
MIETKLLRKTSILKNDNCKISIIESFVERLLSRIHIAGCHDRLAPSCDYTNLVLFARCHVHVACCSLVLLVVLVHHLRQSLQNLNVGDENGGQNLHELEQFLVQVGCRHLLCGCLLLEMSLMLAFRMLVLLLNGLLGRFLGLGNAAFFVGVRPALGAPLVATLAAEPFGCITERRVFQ